MENEIYEKHVCENETVLIQLNTFDRIILYTKKLQRL